MTGMHKILPGTGRGTGEAGGGGVPAALRLKWEPATSVTRVESPLHHALKKRVVPLPVPGRS